MSPFAKAATFLLTIAFPLLANAKILSKETYNYPILDSDEATIAASAIHTDPCNSEEIKLKIKDRRIQDYRRDRDLDARFYPSQYANSHLVVIISGIGGDYRSGYSAFLAAQTQLRGADAVVLPNAFTTNFIISSSTSGLVGGSAADAADMYEVIVALKKDLAARGHNYSRISLVGYSHGALTAAFLEANDQRARSSRRSDAVTFDSALLINPPVDLLHAIRTIDARTKATSGIGLKTLIKLAFRFKKMVSKFSQIFTTNETHVEFSNSLKMDAEQRFALIGKAMSTTLPESILASQGVDDLEILPYLEENPSSVNYRYSRQARSSEASRYNYEGYVKTFFTARAVKTKEPFSLEYLNQVNSLTALTSILQNTDTIFLMHNANDMLLTNGQAYWLDQVFGKRAIIYPTGGHLGNMWYPDNLNDYHRWLYYGRF